LPTGVGKALQPKDRRLQEDGMQQQEYNLVVKRLDRLERRARWHWVERVLTLGLVTQFLVSGPVGASLREKAKLQAQKAAENARLALAKGANAARRTLLVRPALDPRMVLEDQQEAALDAMPMPPAERAPVSAPATRARVTRPHFEQQAALLAEQRPVSGPSSRSETAPPAATAKAGPLTPLERAQAWSSSVSQAERQMARAAESSAEPLASLGPLASGAPALNGVGSATLGFPMPGELAAPEKLWKAVGAARTHRSAPAGRDPFNFAGPFAAQSGHLASVQPASAVRSSQSEPVAADSTASVSSLVMESPEVAVPPTSPSVTAPPPPSITLKALGYALSADGNAQAVLSGGNTLYVVNEGEEFADRFRVTAIRPEYLEVEDELTNQIIRLPLGD